MIDSKKYDSVNPANKKLPTLDFEGKKYDINVLPDEVKDLLKALQIAGTQIRVHKDTLRLWDLGKNSIMAQLKQKLENICPVEN